VRVPTAAWSQRQCSGAYSRKMIFLNDSTVITPSEVRISVNVFGTVFLLLFKSLFPIRRLLGLPDTDPASLVGGTDPDPFIIKQK
jgi:hypothetical protein